MKKIKVFAIALLALAVSATAYAADIKVDKDAKIQYEVPAGLKATSAGNFTALDEPKKELAFLIVRSDNNDMDKATKAVDIATDQAGLKDVKQVGDPAKINQNGMDAVQMRATGTYNGKPANVMMLVLPKTPGGKIVIIVGVVVQSAKDAWAPAFKQFVTSIKPAS